MLMNNTRKETKKFHTIFLEREEQPTVDEGGRLVVKMPRASVLELFSLKTGTSPTETKR